MKRYKLSEIPKGQCFSRDIMLGSYYNDTEYGEKKTYHSYDIDGLINPSACPKLGVEWYLSDVYGNEIVSLRDRTVWQYLMWSKNLNRFVISTDYYESNAEFLQANDGVEEFERLLKTQKKKEKIATIKYQYLYQNNCNKLWELSYPLTKREAFEKNLFGAKRLEETRTYDRN